MSRLATKPHHQRVDRRKHLWTRALGLIFLLSLALFTSLTPTPRVAAQSFWTDLLTGVELVIGESVAASVNEEYGEPIRLAPARQAWVDTIFADVVAQAGRKEIPYTLSVLNTDVVNAFAAPGGYLFITTGLLHYIGNDADALANVLGHEIAHVEHKHGMNGLVRRLGLGLLLGLVFGDSEDSEVWETVAVVATELMHLGWSREQEHESDELGQQLAAQAGYDPNGMVRFFGIIQQLEGQEVAFLEFLSTHPLTSDRTERARVRAGSLFVSARPEPKPIILPDSRSITTERPASAGGPQVITRGGSAANTEPVPPPPPAPLPPPVQDPSAGRVISRGPAQPEGTSYDDPAQRFSLHLPVGWAATPEIFYYLTKFAGPDKNYIWVSVVDAQPEETVLIAAHQTLAEYGEIFTDLRVEVSPHSAVVTGLPAAYTEYSYTDSTGNALREGGYFVMHAGHLYILQFTTPPQQFAAKRAQYESVVQTFRFGANPAAGVPAGTLEHWPVVSTSIENRMTIDISELWPNTWERSPETDPGDDHQLAEFAEIGGNGYMAVYMYEVESDLVATDTAEAWLDWLSEGRHRLTIVEGIRHRWINQQQWASFIVSWWENGERWMQYCTTIVVGNKSYEIAFIYREAGFDARRPIFDRWLGSWRIHG